MELQGLQEALKVELQCHQVSETWLFLFVGVWEQEGDIQHLEGKETRRHVAALSNASHFQLEELKLLFCTTLSADGGCFLGEFGVLMRGCWLTVAIRTRPEYL